MPDACFRLFLRLGITLLLLQSQYAPVAGAPLTMATMACSSSY
jgi:hypothetical protein